MSLKTYIERINPVAIALMAASYNALDSNTKNRACKVLEQVFNDAFGPFGIHHAIDHFAAIKLMKSSAANDGTPLAETIQSAHALVNTFDAALKSKIMASEKHISLESKLMQNEIDRLNVIGYFIRKNLLPYNFDVSSRLVDECDIDYEATAKLAGWSLTYDDDENKKGPVLVHEGLERLWPAPDWKGALEDIDFDPQDDTWEVVRKSQSSSKPLM